MSKTQIRVARNRTFAVNDLADAIRRHINLPRQGTGGKVQLSQFIAEYFTRVYGVTGHLLLPFIHRV